MTANANPKEIHIVTRAGLYRDRREGYKFLPSLFWRAEFGRTIIAHAAQLAAWTRTGYNPRPVFIVDWNWDLAPNRPIKVSVAMFEYGSGFIQLGKGEVRKFMVPPTYLPAEEFDTYDYREAVRLFIRRMLREGQI